MTTANFLTTGAQPQGGASMLVSLLPMVLIFAVFYFILIRPQKKKDKETAKMRSNMEIGDEIVTIGGIIGRVVSLKDDTVLIETGSDRSKIRFLRSAIQQNNTAHENAMAEKAAKDAAKAAEKPAKAEKAEKPAKAEKAEKEEASSDETK